MLKVLPEHISNLIAAGEVVARPASVVKELVENSVDAGAKSVTVSVVDAGRTLIQIIDDGCGMSPEEAVLCFERHATSKISEAADLDCISTFGFRGEALASVAAVSEVRLRTRREDDTVGVCVNVTASKLVSTEPVSTPVGSNFEIRNLFYNVPARRKFLKSDSAELKHIISEFTRVALTRPHIALRLISNGRDIYNLRAVDNEVQRIRAIFGSDLTKDLVPLETETSVLSIRGWIGAPEDARKTAGNQYLFINGRYFRSPYFNKAVTLPYEKLIPEGYNPTFFIYLETSPDRVDVNVHPAKTEVKFEDEAMVFDIIKAAVREGLGRSSFVPSIDFDMKGAPEIPTIQSTFSRGYAAPPKIDYEPLFNPFEMEGHLSRDNYEPAPVDGYDRLFQDSPAEMTQPMIVFGGKYIITPTDQGLAVINVLRARERVFFERYEECVAEEQPVVQQSLFPVTLKLSPEDYLSIMDDLDRISSMGFDIRDFGDSSIVVYGLPEGYCPDEENVRRGVDELIAALRDDDPAEDFRFALAARMAKSAAKMHGGSISEPEARLLTSQLMDCRCPSTTADGRRVMTILTTEDLDKRL